MTAIAQALRTALLHFVWQGLVVAFLLWVALYVMRKRPAQARYLASCAALVLLTAMPVVTACLAYQAPAAVSAPAQRAAAVTTPGGRAPVRPESTAQSWMVRLEPWALPLWSAGVLFFSLRIVWACWRVSAMRRRGRPADAETLAMVAGLGERIGLSRPVRVLTAALPDGPSVAGWLRPVLLLPPATVLGLTPQQLEAVLAHELAHIRRYDHLVNALQTLVETLLFYHPAVWWTSARIRAERELCCDDMAVHACGDALCFARALTKLERLRVMTPATALGSTGGPLMYRVQRLVGATHQECAPSKVSGIVAFSLGLVCLGLNVHWAHAQDAVAQEKHIFYFAGDMNRDGDAPGVSVDLGGASLLHRPSVGYPVVASNSGIQGTVAVQVTLDASGNVSDAHVVSGPMELRKTVMQSIFEWHFAQDAAGSVRMVNLTFQKSAAVVAEAEQAALTRQVPGLLVGVATTAEEPVLQQGQVAMSTLTIAPTAPSAEERWQQEQIRRQLEKARKSLASQDTPQTREEIQRLEAELAPSAPVTMTIPSYQMAAPGGDTREISDRISGVPGTLTITPSSDADPDLLRRRLQERRADLERQDTPQTREQIQKLEAELAAQGSRENATRVVADTDANRVLIWNHIPTSNNQNADVVVGQDARKSEADRRNSTEPTIAGRTLTRIDVMGLSDSAQTDLLSRLPVQVGDTLTEQSWRAVDGVVRKFDEHLNWRTELLPNGSASIHIEAPDGTLRVRK